MLILYSYLTLMIIYSIIYCCDIPIIYFIIGTFALSFLAMLWCSFRLTKKKTIISIIFAIYWLITFPITICLAITQIAMKETISIELLQMISLQSIHGIIRYHWLNLSLGIMFLTLWLLLSYFIANKSFSQYRFTPKWNGFVYFIISMVLNFSCLYYTFRPFQDKIIELYEVKNMSIDYISKNGIEGIMFNKNNLLCSPGYNLVHIFLESTEQNYTNQQKFPNLTPELYKLLKNNIHFSNIDMAPNASMTFGGIYASLKGFNITKFHIRNNIHNQNIWIGKQFVSMPDILHSAGYLQYFIYGHNSSFANFNSFLESEHFSIKMLHNGQNRKQHSLQYVDSIRDSELFEAAWKKFNKLSKKEQPFSLTCLTVDAHAPSGICDSNKKLYRWNQKKVPQLLHAIHNTDKALGLFIKRICESKVATKTVIVIQSDHLSHPFTPEIILNHLENQRKMLFLIITPDKTNKNISTAGRTYDIAPTILHAMKVKHNCPFLLGRNLFTKKTQSKFLNDKEQQKALEGAMFFNKSLDFHVKKHGISFQEKPYPHIKIGTQKIFIRNDYSGNCDIPRNGECLSFKATYSFDIHILSSYQSDNADHVKSKENHFFKYYHNFIFGAEKDNSGFYFIYNSPRKTIKKKSKTFSGVKFNANEIFD